MFINLSPWQLLGLLFLFWLGSIALMFFVFYVAMLALRAVNAMSNFEKCGALWRSLLITIPLLICGLIVLSATVYDWMVNHTSAVLLFFDLPQERLVTSRLERYKRGDGWRKHFAELVCTKCLDWADPSGKHCK